MKLVQPFFLLLVVAGCLPRGAISSEDWSTSKVQTIRCEDEYSKKNGIFDNGLTLELNMKQNSKEFYAVISKRGYVREVIRELTVVQSTPYRAADSEVGFQGEHFYFALKNGKGLLRVSLPNPIVCASQKKPTRTLNEPMLCTVERKL